MLGWSSGIETEAGPDCHGQASKNQIFYSHLNRTTIPGLNGLRAFAVFAVVLYHFDQHTGLKTWPFPGPYGVVCFFVLSGFLITWLLVKEKNDRGAVNLRNFWIRRALRILPAFYAYWLIQVFLLGRVPVDFWPAALYFYNYFQGSARGWIPGLMAHTWSLAVEEQFYVFWPILFALFPDRRMLKRYLLAAILLIEFLRPIACFFLPEWYVYEAFEFRCDALMIGCLTALLLRDRIGIPSWIFSPVTTVAAICTFPIMMKANSQIVFAMVGNTATAYASAALILQAILYAPLILENSVIRHLGTISYAIYLYHALFLDIIDHHRNWPIPALILIYLGGTLAAASGSYYVVERRFMRYKRIWASKRNNSLLQ